jgi:glycerate dehydrogenase
MKIVVLDGYVLNPGDLSWAGLYSLSDDVRIYDRTQADLILARARDAEILLTNKTPLSAPTLYMLDKLRYIGVLATGYDVVDIQAARARQIPVTNVPDYGTSSVAEFVFALLMELWRPVALHAQVVSRGEWTCCPDFSFWKTPLVELAGKTLGVVGFGRIGRRVGEIASVLGMRVIATGNQPGTSPQWPGFRWRSFEELLAEADVVSLHCPLTPATEGMINASSLALMKPGAVLINTARGRLIVEQDLAAALDAGRLAGAALDVLSSEPPAADNPLLHARNCLVTPHMAWATREARSRLLDIVVDNLKAFLAGRPVNVVNAAKS